MFVKKYFTVFKLLFESLTSKHQPGIYNKISAFFTFNDRKIITRIWMDNHKCNILFMS